MECCSALTLLGIVVSGDLVACISPVSILRLGDLTRVSIPARNYFSSYATTTDQHQDSVEHAVFGLSE